MKRGFTLRCVAATAFVVGSISGCGYVRHADFSKYDRERPLIVGVDGFIARAVTERNMHALTKEIENSDGCPSCSSDWDCWAALLEDVQKARVQKRKIIFMGYSWGADGVEHLIESSPVGTDIQDVLFFDPTFTAYRKLEVEKYASARKVEVYFSTAPEDAMAFARGHAHEFESARAQNRAKFSLPKYLPGKHTDFLNYPAMREDLEKAVHMDGNVEFTSWKEDKNRK